MKMTNILKFGFALSLASLLCSCTKDGVGSNDGVALNFSSETAETVSLKGAAATSVDDFFAMGFDGTAQWFPDPAGSTSPMRVQLTSGSKIYSSYLWPRGAIKTFYAYSNNLPKGFTASITSSEVTLNCNSIPVTAADQKDVTLGFYSGNGKNAGKAEMAFYHPLAQLVFKVGDITDVTAITEIAVEGVYDSGSTSLSTSTPISGSPATAGFEWTGKDGQVAVIQSVSGSLPSSGSTIGVPFMLIPQDLSSRNILVKISATVGGSTKVLVTTLDTGSLVAGKKNIFTLNYGAKKLTFTSTLEDWGEGNNLSSALDVQDALPGVFCIDGSNKKVRFSKGNLYYDGGWHFENYQYDYRTYGGYPSCIDGIYKLGGTPSGHWGLFGWVGASSTEFTTEPEIYGVSFIWEDSWQEGKYYGNNIRDNLKKEWGTTIDDKGTWRTLTYLEWSRILGICTSRGNRKDPYLFAKARINDVPGLIIFPDGYNGITSGDGLATVNAIEVGFPATSIPETIWTSMEVEGVVFLPAAGGREDYYFYGNNGSYQSSSAGSRTDWKQDQNPAAGCYSLSFYDDDLFVDVWYRSMGSSVRLVTDIN